MRGRTVRFAQTVGLALGCWATIFVLGVLFIGCDASGPTKPEPVAAPPQASAAASAPAPTATPTAVDPTQPSSFELSCLPDSSLSVKYTGQASQATVETFYTTFDNQELVFGKQSHLVNTGGTVDRTFPDVCIQGDADQPGVKLIGGCFYDINGKPFNPSREPAKITECRSRCVEKWIESEPVREKESEWSKCVAPETDSFQANGEGCYGTKSRTYELVVYEVNSCTKAKREKSRTQKTEEERCEIECPCVGEWKDYTEYGGNYPRYSEWSVWSSWGECDKGERARTRTRTKFYYEQNSCTKEIRVDESKTKIETEIDKERCEEPCNAPTLGTFTFDKPLGDEKDECKKFGDYEPTCKTDAPQGDEIGAEGGIASCPQSGTTFYLSKCGEATYVLGTSYPPACPDGRGLGLSHTTGCVCKD